MKETIQTNPAQAAEEAEHLIKGKNKKNVELLVAIGNTYLDADKLPEAQEYATLARKANGKSALASVLEGNIAVKQKMRVLLLKSMRRQFISIRNVRKLI